MRGKLYVGIDPGANTGIAEWDGKEFTHMATYTFWEAIYYLMTILDCARARNLDMIIYIEDPNLNPATHDHQETKSNIREKISQNVGSNKRDAQLLIEYCEKWMKYKVHRIKPSKYSASKLSAEKFRTQTGYTKQTSQHVRDAAMLVYQR